jgi:hypothetical protein
MKNWFNKNYKTLIIAAFLIPIITVAVVSISHVTKWYGISNPVTWAVYLSIGIEIAALSALAAISANMGKKVYFPFAIVTVVQFIGNIYFAYSYIDITSKSFQDWVGLVSPLVEFMGVDPSDFSGHKRFLAFFAGGMLPLISLSFLHMLVKFTEEDRINGIENDTEEKIINNVEAKDIIGEVSRLRLSDKDLEILEKHLSKSPPPNEKLKEAAKRYSDEVREKHTHIDDFDIEHKKRGELLAEMMKNDQELGLYDEPFDNPMIKDNEDQPYDVENGTEQLNDWDVTLMDGLEDEPSFFTEEETENIFQEEPTEEEVQENFSTITPETENIFQDDDYLTDAIKEFNQESIEEEFDGFVPEPFATPEEVEELKIDVVVETPEEENVINVVIDDEVLIPPTQTEPLPTPKEQVIKIDFSTPEEVAQKEPTLVETDVEKKNN